MARWSDPSSRVVAPCRDAVSRRQAWFAGWPDLDPERLVFIDEPPAFAGAGSRSCGL
jgi:hypothetical protein